MSKSHEADSSLVCQEALHFLWNPNIHYRVHKSPQAVPTLNLINTVHTLPIEFPKNNFNIVLTKK